MSKIYKKMLLFMLLAMSAVSVKAELISLKEVPFGVWNGYGADAQMTSTVEPLWVLDTPDGNVYGDASVINYADLSNYTKLIVVAKDGTPRFLLNRDIADGQFNADESQSHLIEYPKDGTWVDKYFSKAAGDNEGETVYTVDLKAIAKDKGFAHLHAIKGANWANVTVTSMMVERQAKAPQGWTSIINNGDFEGDDVSSFPVALNAVNVEGTQDATIEEGAGYNGSRGITIESLAGATEGWATQLFVKFNELLPEGTKWRFTMQVKADYPANVTSGSHAAPRSWIAGGIIDAFDVSTEWQTVQAEGTATKDLADNAFQSIAFDLNNDKENANKFYFDNINFEVFKLGTTAEFSNDVILVDFGFDTNIPELVKKSGKKRLIFPEGTASVKVNGEAVDLYSIEGFEDGRFYIFLDAAASETDEVEVSFTNPANEAYHLLYTSGAVSGQDVKDFEGVATLNQAVEDNDGYPYDFLTPVVMEADPEDGSFNLPNSISEFKLTFDKEVDCAAIKATLNGKALTVEPATDYASAIVLKREAGDLPTGEYTLNVTKIYPKLRLADEVFGDTTLILNVGKPEYDPNDVPKEMLAETFNAAGANTVPEGYFVKFGTEDRVGGANYGGGSRMFDFGAGGDFTKGLYFREGYVEYGSTEGYALTLEAGKKYQIHFNTAMWKDNGSSTRFEIFNEAGEVVYVTVVANKPNVNGSTGAVTGSAAFDYKFIPEATGNYTLRWTSSGSETGDPAYMEIILANPSVKYVPNQAGIEYVQLLDKALADAITVRDGNADERYDGAEIDALKAAIEKYTVEKEGYTNPSAYEKAAADLNALAEAMKNHRQLCDDYDTNVKKAIDVVRQNEQPNGDAENPTKFVTTDLFAQLKGIVSKYNGSSEWKNVSEDPEVEDFQLFYTFDVLKDNEALKTAIKELSDIANVTSLLFTEGTSAPDGANGGKGTGVAVLVDRLRHGAEALKTLGFAADDPLIVGANKSLTDDDELAEAIKNRVTSTIYADLAKGAESTIFTPVIDPESLVEVAPTYDLTVFVKNPNTYKQLPNADFTEENVPGWVTPEGYNKPGLTTGWSAPKNVEGIAEDAMFQTWGGSYRVEQTITDLPAGVYTIYYGFSDRDSADDLTVSYAYAKTTTNFDDENADGQIMNLEAIGQAFPFAEGSGSVMIENVVVADGVLTIGVNAGDGSKTFFNDVHLYLTGAIDGFDYKGAIETGIEAAQNAKVRAIEIYDLNGRRMAAAPRGISIVKMMMSDGTVRTQKVIRK